MKIVEYTDTGQITSISHIFTPEYEHQEESNKLLLNLEDEVTFENHWVNNGSIELRPESPIELEGHTFINVPNQAQVFINNSKFDAIESTIELELDEGTTYNIRILSFPYKDFTTEIIT